MDDPQRKKNSAASRQIGSKGKSGVQSTLFIAKIKSRA